MIDTAARAARLRAIVPITFVVGSVSVLISLVGVGYAAATFEITGPLIVCAVSVLLILVSGALAAFALPLRPWRPRKSSVALIASLTFCVAGALEAFDTFQVSFNIADSDTSTWDDATSLFWWLVNGVGGLVAIAASIVAIVVAVRISTRHSEWYEATYAYRPRVASVGTGEG